MRVNIVLPVLICFGVLTSLVITGVPAIIHADLAIDTGLLHIRTPVLTVAFLSITYLGNFTVAFVLTFIASLYFFLSRRSIALATGLLVSEVGAALSDYILKGLIERARPTGLIPYTVESYYSFPSGHATEAMALYGFLAIALASIYPQKTKLIAFLATFLILAVGLSRLYLGVHFPSDVVGGYLLGGVWIGIGYEVASRIARRKRSFTSSSWKGDMLSG